MKVQQTQTGCSSKQQQQPPPEGPKRARRLLLGNLEQTLTVNPTSPSEVGAICLLILLPSIRPQYGSEDMFCSFSANTLPMRTRKATAASRPVGSSAPAARGPQLTPNPHRKPWVSQHRGSRAHPPSLRSQNAAGLVNVRAPTPDTHTETKLICLFLQPSSIRILPIPRGTRSTFNRQL